MSNSSVDQIVKKIKTADIDRRNKKSLFRLFNTAMMNSLFDLYQSTHLSCCSPEHLPQLFCVLKDARYIWEIYNDLGSLVKNEHYWACVTRLI